MGVLDPRLRALIERESKNAKPSGLSVIEARELAHQRKRILIADCFRRPPDVAKVDDLVVPVENGELALRVYHPNGISPFPAHLYLHGGGFWHGNIEIADGPCRELCSRAGVVIVSVGYRLAPEHPFPTGAEDCYAILCWVAENSTALGIDATRLSIGGESAGGGLAAVVSLMTRDRNGPSLALQVLGIPVTDLTMSQPSITEMGQGYVLTQTGIAEYRARYLPSLEQVTHPYASPLFAEVSGVAPALVMTMEFDPLRDEGEAFARRLIEAGVRTTQQRWLGHIHGSALFTRLLADDANAYHQTIADAIVHAHSSPGPSMPPSRAGVVIGDGLASSENPGDSEG